MRVFQLISAAATFCLFGISCIPKELDIQVKSAPVRLAVSSSIIPNRVMIVSLTRTFSGLENRQNEDTLAPHFMDKILVKNAIVTVKYSNKTDTLHKISDGVYASFNTLLTNYNYYELYAKDLETGLEITSSTHMLPYYQFDTIGVYKKITNVDTSCFVSYELSDNLNTENYYVVNYIRKLNKQNNVLDFNQIFTNGSNSFENDFDLLNDASFTKGKFKIDKKLNTVRPEDSVAVTVANISSSYYEFLSVLKRSGSFINTITGEPLNYPSNVRNGHGYFNAYYPQIVFFDMRNY
jgi:hypothetical protein